MPYTFQLPLFEVVGSPTYYSLPNSCEPVHLYCPLPAQTQPSRDLEGMDPSSGALDRITQVNQIDPESVLLPNRRKPFPSKNHDHPLITTSTSSQQNPVIPGFIRQSFARSAVPCTHCSSPRQSLVNARLGSTPTQIIAMQTWQVLRMASV